jgi:hypothetical protein
MNLYDRYLDDIQELLEPFPGTKLSTGAAGWPDAGNGNMVLRRDMAFELGGSGLPAVGGIGFTDRSVDDEGIWLYGPDLAEIREDQPFARIVVAGVDVGQLPDRESIQKAYNIFRSIEYEKYHVGPQGYMMRISVSGNREPVRVSRESLQTGLDFGKVGDIFVRAYRKHPEVRQVKVIFVTDPEFPYDRLAEVISHMELVTDSLDYIFKNIKMDCTSCVMKPVCDEVEGLRELHQEQ